MGRPTKYSQKVLQEAVRYLDDFHEDGSVIPSISGLALRLGIRRETLQVWKNDPDKEALSNILEDILAKQETLLLNKGLLGEFNSAIVKLALGKHGYTGKPESVVIQQVPVEHKWVIQPVKSLHELARESD